MYCSQFSRPKVSNRKMVYYYKLLTFFYCNSQVQTLQPLDGITVKPGHGLELKKRDARNVATYEFLSRLVYNEFVQMKDLKESIEYNEVCPPVGSISC